MLYDAANYKQIPHVPPGRVEQLRWQANIDGLRGVAILSVVSFHCGLPLTRGGFVGVDIFFVISGFLITGLIIAADSQGQFSFGRFYGRRVRRLAPALLTTVGVIMIFGAIVCVPHDFKQLGDIALSTLVGVSNFSLFHTSNYFDTGAATSPLLHTWSLGVEEQFYLVCPLAIVTLGRWGAHRRAGVLLALACVSFALCVWETRERQEVAFYLPAYRAWEFLIGSLFSMIPPPPTRGVRESGASIGAAAIAIAVVTFRSEMGVPGAWALVPCVGAGLMIWANKGGGTSTLGVLLSAPPLRYVGRISYSLYLWHWPILAFWRYRKGGESLDVGETIVAISVAFALAAFSYHLIEDPIRTRRLLSSRRRFATALAALSLPVLILALSASQFDGVPQRLPSYASPPARIPASYRDGTCLIDKHEDLSSWSRQECTINPGGILTTMIWGDSFAVHYFYGMVSLAPRLGTRLVLYAHAGCPPVLGRAIPTQPHCRTFDDNVVKVISANRVSVVIMSARWETYLGKGIDTAMIEQTIATLHHLGVRVIFISQSPSFDFATPYDYQWLTGRTAARVRFHGSLLATLRGVRGSDAFFEPMGILCRGAVCPLRANGAYLYYDGGHFTDTASLMEAAALAPLVAQFASAGAATAPAGIIK